jgi:Ca2+-transporting ATPase
MLQDMHTPVSFSQLSGWHECESFDFIPRSWIAHGSGPVELRSACDYFGTAGKAKASTLSLTVLVTIEMLNSLNALSEQSSLVQAPPWSNPYLLLAGAGSMLVHCVILYTPFFARIFSTVPLSANEWVLVLAFSVPVVLIEEVLKWVGRRYRL